MNIRNVITCITAESDHKKDSRHIKIDFRSEYIKSSDTLAEYQIKARNNNQWFDYERETYEDYGYDYELIGRINLQLNQLYHLWKLIKNYQLI